MEQEFSSRETSEIKEESKEIIWENPEVAIKLPDVQAIPAAEGTHMQVIPKREFSDWRRDSVRKVLDEGFYALAAARIIADSGYTEDLWANVHWNSRFSQGANVFGRKPISEAGWAKPVKIMEEGVQTPQNQERRQHLSELAKRYFPLWEQLKDKIAVIIPPFKILPAKGHGGIERIAEGMINELLCLGHRVTLLGAGRCQTKADYIPIFPKTISEQKFDSIQEKLTPRLEANAQGVKIG